MIIVPFLGGAFDQDDIKAMSMALDDVCKTLNLTGGANAARQVIVERIIELTRRDERSPRFFATGFYSSAVSATDRTVTVGRAGDD
jgi:hypothetical protein